MVSEGNRGNPVSVRDSANLPLPGPLKKGPYRAKSGRNPAVEAKNPYILTRTNVYAESYFLLVP